MLSQNISILNWKIFNFNPLVAGFKRCWIPFLPHEPLPLHGPKWKSSITKPGFCNSFQRVSGWWSPKNPRRLMGFSLGLNGGLSLKNCCFFMVDCHHEKPWIFMVWWCLMKFWINQTWLPGPGFGPLKPRNTEGKHREDWKCWIHWMGAQGSPRQPFTSLIVGISVMRSWQTEIG